jgi:hypothetical protein
MCINFFSQPLSTQENEKAHRRYWYYRTRLINDFLKIGGNQGDCIVFAERNIGSQASTQSFVGPDQIDITNQYLATLALEYKLLTRNNQSTQETIKEIYYLIKTLNRLDAFADIFWNGSPPVFDNLSGQPENIYLNGFMLREDMPKDYILPNTLISNYKHYNYAFNEYNFQANNITDNNCSFTGLYKTDKLNNGNKFSNYVGFNPSPIPNQNYAQLKQDLSLPHDKYYSMFIAFMLIDKYIPAGTIYYENGTAQPFQDGTYDIKQEVRNITNRCHPYLRGNTFGGPLSDWMLEYPDGINIVAGAAAWPWSFPLTKMICKINNNYPWNIQCNGYGDVISNLNIITYNALSLSGGGPSEDGGVFQAYSQAGSNFPSSGIPIWLGMDITTSYHSIEWMDLLRKVLHQTGTLTRQKSVYANPINDAPCTGPYNFGCNQPACEWTSPTRTEHPKHRGEGCNVCAGFTNNNTGLQFAGNYPGVDYMLLHNLYYEYLNQLDDANPNSESGRYKTAYNLMDNHDASTWPVKINIPGFGGTPAHSILMGVSVEGTLNGPGNTYTTSSIAKVKVFQNLTSRAQIYATTSPAAPNNTVSSKVEYRAGKDISLLPEGDGQQGFEVKLGSDFYAHIKRYVCTDGDYGSGLKQNPNEENVASNDYESDEMNTIVPIHHVDYPPSDSDLNPLPNEEEPTTFADAQSEQAQLQQLLIEQQNADKGIYNSNKELDQRFLVMPNPNNGAFTIYANKIADDEEFTLSIIDMKGQQILFFNHLTTNVQQSVDLTNYSKGIYLVKITSNKGFNSTKKVNIN